MISLNADLFDPDEEPNSVLLNELMDQLETAVRPKSTGDQLAICFEHEVDWILRTDRSFPSTEANISQRPSVRKSVLKLFLIAEKCLSFSHVTDTP